MVYLIDPANLKGKACPKNVCFIVCTPCPTLCPKDFVQPLYGLPEEEE